MNVCYSKNFKQYNKNSNTIKKDKQEGLSMKAIVKDKPQMDKQWPIGFRITEKPEPQITAADQVKVKVVAAGICGTDVGIYHSKESIKSIMSQIKDESVIVGHEFCGEVEDAGDLAKVQLARALYEKAKWDLKDSELQSFINNKTIEQMANDSNLIPLLKEKFYITAEMHVICGVCHQCRTGNGHACQNTIIKGIHEDGIFTKYAIVPSFNITLFKKGEIPPEIIAFMDAFGNALHTVSSIDLMGKRVAVLGTGVQGLMAIAIAKFSGASLIVATDVSMPSHGITSEKLENYKFKIARNVGADYCFDMAKKESKKELIETVMRETNNTGVDAVFEMSGSPYAYSDALDIIRMGGTFSLLGIPAQDLTLDFSGKIIFKGLTIKGIIGRKMFDTWETMERLLKAGLSDIMMENGFVSHTYSLEDYEKGFEAHEKGEAIKVVLKP